MFDIHGGCDRLLSNMYHPSITSSHDVFALCRFNKNGSNPRHPDRGQYEDRFIAAFERYLRGEGSPAGVEYSGFYTETHLDPTGPLSRGRLFLASVTGSDIPLPILYPPPISVSIAISHAHDRRSCLGIPCI